MAEEDAEKAFFQAQTMNANTVDYGTVEGQDADNSDSDDYDPSKTLQDQYSASLTDPKQSENVHSSAAPFDPSSSNETSPSQDPNPVPETGDVPQDEEESASMPPSSSHVPQNTKTIGGFVVEDEEENEVDEDDRGDTDYEPPAVLGAQGADTSAQQPLSGNANQAISTPDVSFNEPAQDPAGSKIVPNSSYSPSPASKNDVSAAGPGQSLYGSQALQPESAQESVAPTPTPDLSSTSRGRLPHDRVGILEDRIQEDPRGDTAAWLELISEHRSRNRIDNARETYERFLKVFPLAVSKSLLSAERKLIEERPNNGLHMRTWNPSSTSCTASSRYSTGPS